MKIYNLGSLNIDYVYTVDHFVTAGDTFTGYFIASLTSGQDVASSIDIAAKASSITVSRQGASTSIPLLDEVYTNFLI